ncbi:hypothetical protein I542_0456 [Mycobacteroides abscessus 1948]|uniref:Uncharacterized protein n=1 Tax=Mycobacteroides abscessus 1948 TaxID=1299323 RepID=A0A829QB59_9MYCO|nr:hypothetical protein L836_1612 [Mycobacteroides abscessus MAB_110811_2726]EUA60324.1 hypothetical protein I542_0456 [Mycobacteroides abscessus 1948]
MLVEVIDRTASFNDSCDPVTVSIAASRYPNAAADILSADLAVLPNSQRRSSCHRCFFRSWC